MIRLFAIFMAALANAVAASLFATAAVAQNVTTDIGTLDKETVEKVVSFKAALLALCGAQFSDKALLRRHALAHIVFDGRRRVWCSAWPEGRLSLCKRPRGYRFKRAAGQTFAASGFPCSGGPLGWDGLFPAADEWRPDPAFDAAGTEMV